MIRHSLAGFLVAGMIGASPGLACPPAPGDRAAYGVWELAGSPLGTPIAVENTASNTSFAAYFVTLGITHSNVYWGVAVEHIRHGHTMSQELADCFWKPTDHFAPWLDLALDPAGNPSIAYQNENGDLRYAQYDPGTSVWNSELILPQATNGSWRALAYDSADRAVVVNWDATAGQLSFWRRDVADSWSLHAIASGTDLQGNVGVVKIPGSGFEIYGAAGATNAIRMYSLSGSDWIEQTISTGTNAVSGLSMPRNVSGTERCLFYVDGLARFHALRQATNSALWEDCGNVAATNVSGLSAARMVAGSLVAGYENGGANMVSFTPATSNLATWAVATNWTYNVSWHYVGKDMAIVDEGCGQAGTLFRYVNGNNKIGNTDSAIEWAFAGPASGPESYSPHAVDWTWAYHDDDDGIDDRRTEFVPGTNVTFIPSRPILDNQEFRIYFLTDDNFAGDNNGNAWIRWWNGESETWLPTFRLFTFDLSPWGFHGQDLPCYSPVAVWAAVIWASATRPGTNYYAIQLTSPNLSPADWDYLLRTAPATAGSGLNNANQAMSEEADYVGHDWLIYIGPDSDGDGMDDDWETTYFGSTTNGVPEEDSDQDGNLNLAEFLQGTSPKDPGSRFSAWLADSTNRLHWTTVGQRTYRVQINSNLVGEAWRDLDDIYVSETNETESGMQSVPVPTTATACFFRVNLAR